jgi:hypothetical protein
VGAREAALRVARLTQEYSELLGELPRRILEQLDGATRGREGSGRRRRQGRVID